MGGPYSCWVHSVRAWTDMDSDPVCFDIKSGTNSKDYRIVKIDHGEILCNYRVKVVKEIAPSFRHLVLQTSEVKTERACR
jgi:hypothetical protein